MSARQKHAPAIVLGADTPIGLTVIRELGEHGVPVHAVARSREGVGLYSRWTSSRNIRPNTDAGAIDLLNRIAADHGARFLIVISERDLIFVRKAADHGSLTGLTPLIPPIDQLAIVGDKIRTYEFAKEVGIPLPFSWQPTDGAPDVNPPQSLVYPCVLKWRNPEAVQDDLGRHGIPLLKSEYCYDAEELLRALARYASLTRYPLVQAYYPGVGLGHMILIHEGRPILKFQHRRISEWPPEGGVSTVCESMPLSDNAALFEKSVALLQRIGWQGAAMVEYRFDPGSGEAALMEVNGRFWGSLPLAYHAGAQFAWFTYAALGLGRKLEQPDYRVGIRCRYMVPETRRIITLFSQNGRTQNRAQSFDPLKELLGFASQFANLRSRYYVFTFADPKPFFADSVFVLRKAISIARRYLGRRFASFRRAGTAESK